MRIQTISLTVLLLLVFLLLVTTLYIAFTDECFYKFKILKYEQQSDVDFRPGEIIVKFQDNISEEDARSTIHSFGLSSNAAFKNPFQPPQLLPETEPDWVLFGALITVPASTERYWSCKLEKHPKIEYSNPNWMKHLLS